MLFVFCLMDNKFLLWMLVKTESNSTNFPLAKHLATLQFFLHFMTLFANAKSVLSFTFAKVYTCT